MKKRVLPIVLMVTLLLTMLPSAVLAATPNVSIDSSKSEVTRTEEFTVTLNVPAVNDPAYSVAFRIGFDNSAFEVTSFTAPTISGGNLTGYSTVTEANAAGEVSCTYEGNAQENTIDLSQGVALVVTFTTKNNAAFDDYDITVDSTKNFARSIADDGYTETSLITVPTDLKTTVTVVEDSNAGGNEGENTATDYVATLSPATDGVNQGEEVQVTVNVNKVFNSAKIELNYDATVLKFNDDGGALAAGQTMTGEDQAASYENKEANGMGTITILDFGSAFNAGAAYTLTFTSLKGGVTNVTVVSAGFSTAEEAETKDLIGATGEGTSVSINHKVTVNDEEPTYVAPNGTYNGQIPSYNPANNMYDITVKMGNVEQTDPTIDEYGYFQITPVTGELTITYTVTPKQYTVKWDDANNVVTNKNPDTEEVAYGTDITFDVPADKPAQGTEDGWSYNVTITYTGTENEITPEISGQTYKIKGEDLTGDITIKVTKETLSAKYTTIKIEGSDEVQQNGSAVTNIQVEKNSTVTLTLIKLDGYTYTVTQYNGDSTEGTVLTVAENGTFTVSVGDEAVRIVVTKTVIKTGLSVYETEYLSLDGAKMWLVLMNEEKVEDKTYTLTQGGNTYKFFWSDEYDAYCCLAISGKDDTFESVQESLEVEGVIGIANEGPISINYDGNVNMTFDAEDQAVIDINDAQLTWNMYNANYSDFTNISVEKFLRADVNHDYTVDTDDSAAIIAMIQGQ